MASDHTYTQGDRVRVVCDCPGARTGDEGTVVVVNDAEPVHAQMLTILIDSDPATTHGTTVYPHQVEPVPTEH